MGFGLWGFGPLGFGLLGFGLMGFGQMGCTRSIIHQALVQLIAWALKAQDRRCPLSEFYLKSQVIFK